MISKLKDSVISYCIVAALILCAWILIIMRIRLSGDTTAFEFDDTKTHAIQAYMHVYTNGLALNADVNQNDTAPYPTDSGLLWLVNGDNPLGSSFTPSGLVTHQGVRLHPSAYIAYNQMLTTMRAYSIHDLHLLSAYRPYDYQQKLFSAKVSKLMSQGLSADESETLAAKTLQRPGFSEHQTGLALDLTVSGQLTEAFAETKAGQWLAVNSHRFGFIIRYPQAKTEITEIIYEPWHLRYVGVPHASIMYENNLTLEEYSKFIEAGVYLHWENDSSRAFYLVMYSHGWPNEIPQGLVDISSDRMGDGGNYIITVRRVWCG